MNWAVPRKFNEHFVIFGANSHMARLVADRDFVSFDLARQKFTSSYAAAKRLSERIGARNPLVQWEFRVSPTF